MGRVMKICPTGDVPVGMIAVINTDATVFHSDAGAGGHRNNVGRDISLSGRRCRRAGVDPRGEDTWGGRQSREAFYRGRPASGSVEKLGRGRRLADLRPSPQPSGRNRRPGRARYRGASARNGFAVRFKTGKDAEINVASPGGGHKAEFVSWRWSR